MKLNADKNLDPSPLLYWLRWLVSTLISALGGLIAIICSQSLVAGFLTVFLLSAIMMGPVEYRRYRRMVQESEHC